MKYKFFAVPVMTPDAATERLNKFLSSTKIAEVDKQLVPDGQASFWTLIGEPG